MLRELMAAVLIGSGSSLTAAQITEGPERTHDRYQIQNAISEISQAYVARDPEPFERIYLKGFVSVKEKPVFNMREQLIAMMKADSSLLEHGKHLDFETLKFAAGNPRITFYGDTAIVSISKTNLWQYKGQKCLTRTQSTELWLKIDLRWKLAAGHTTTFQCERKPFYPIHPAVANMTGGTKPINPDLEAEQKIHEIMRKFGARATNEAFEGPDPNISDRFISTDFDAEPENSSALLTTMPVPRPARAASLRGPEYTLVIFQDAAIYTYKLRKILTAANDPPEQVSIFFVKTNGRWMAAAAHRSKYDVY